MVLDAGHTLPPTCQQSSAIPEPWQGCIKLAETAPTVADPVSRANPTQERVPRCFRWNGYWACPKDHAPSGAPTLAVFPSPASRRPIRTQLVAPNSRTSGPLFLQPLHQTVSRAAPEPHRSTLDPDRGYYGEAPMGLREYERAVGRRCSPHSTDRRPDLYFEARRRREAPPGVSHDCPVTLPGSSDRFGLCIRGFRGVSKYRTLLFRAPPQCLHRCQQRNPVLRPQSKPAVAMAPA